MVFHLTDYEPVDETRRDPKSQQNSAMKSSQGQGSQLVTAGPRIRVQSAFIGSKLQRTPEEYSDLNRKACGVEFLKSANIGMPRGTTRQSLPDHSKFTSVTLSMWCMSEFLIIYRCKYRTLSFRLYKKILQSTWFRFRTSFMHYMKSRYISFITDYEMVNEPQMDHKIKSKRGIGSSQIQGSRLVVTGPSTRAGCVQGPRRLPRTPDEYAKLNRTTCPVGSPQKKDKGHLDRSNQLQPSCIQPKSTPLTLDNVSESYSTLSDVSEYDEAASGFHTYIVVLQDEAGGDVKQNNILLSTRSACLMDISDDKKAGYGTLNPETRDGYPRSATTDYDKTSNYEELNSATMESYHGFATSDYEKLNKTMMEPNTCAADIDGKSVTPPSPCHVIGPDDKTSKYEKLNPETMESYRGFATSDYEKLNKTMMEPNTCAADIDGKCVIPRSPCPVIGPDDKTSEYEKLNPETMESNRGFATSDNELLNKTLMEPNTCAADIDGKCVTPLSPCSVIGPDDKTSEYVKLNPGTMESYRGFAMSDYEKLNNTMMEPNTCAANIDGKSVTPLSPCPVIGPDDNTSEYEKLNPETMESYRGFAKSDYELLNKTLMEPNTCAADIDGKCVTPSSPCPVIGPDDNTSEYEKLNPETMESYRGFAMSDYEKLNNTMMEPNTCAANIDGKSVTPPSPCPVIGPDDNTSEYEKLNPETMESYRGFATSDYEKLNKTMMEPNTCAANVDGKSVTPRSPCPVIGPDDNTSEYEKLNPETMESYRGFATSDYEKLYKTMMEPNTCAANVDGKSVTPRSPCPVIGPDDKTSEYEKLNPETMEWYHGSTTTDYEISNKIAMEPHTWFVGLDGKSITPPGACPVIESKDKSSEY